METVEGFVVASVDADHQLVGRQAVGEPQSQFCATDASSKSQHSRRPGSFGSYHEGQSPSAIALESLPGRLNFGTWFVGMLKPVGVQLDQPVIRPKYLFHVIADQVQRV